jgi:glyoxylase-like metal-dependent hydrolase (beta-lactamase superfamily II)
LDRTVNVFLIDSGELILLDAGVKGSEAVIFQRMRSLGYRPSDIRKLVLSHSHPDHIGAAPEIFAATGCEVIAHPAERKWIEDPAIQKKERPVPGFDNLVSGPVRVDTFVSDGDGIEMGDFDLGVVHTPGHSPGSITLWSASDRTAITGDAVPVPGDLPIYDDAHATLLSLRRLRGLGIEVMLSAWTGALRGHEVNKRLDAATLLVQSVHRSVVRHCQGSEITPQLVEAVLQDIGLPTTLANPMIARTIRSHLNYKFNIAR